MTFIWCTRLHEKITHNSGNKDTIFQMGGVSMMWLMLKNSFVVDRN